MLDRQDRRGPAREVRLWLDRLSGSVTTQDIEHWFVWSRDPARWAAFRRLAGRQSTTGLPGPFTEQKFLAALRRRPDLAEAYAVAMGGAETSLGLSELAARLAARSRREAELRPLGRHA